MDSNSRRTIWESDDVVVSNLTKAELHIQQFRAQAQKEAGELQPGEEWDEWQDITGRPGCYLVKIRMEIVTT